MTGLVPLLMAENVMASRMSRMPTARPPNRIDSSARGLGRGIAIWRERELALSLMVVLTELSGIRVGRL